MYDLADARKLEIVLIKLIGINWNHLKSDYSEESNCRRSHYTF
jgi:hypothetical protein